MDKLNQKLCVAVVEKINDEYEVYESGEFDALQSATAASISLVGSAAISVITEDVVDWTDLLDAVKGLPDSTVLVADVNGVPTGSGANMYLVAGNDNHFVGISGSLKYTTIDKAIEQIAKEDVVDLELHLPRRFEDHCLKTKTTMRKLVEDKVLKVTRFKRKIVVRGEVPRKVLFSYVLDWLEITKEAYGGDCYLIIGNTF